MRPGDPSAGRRLIRVTRLSSFHLLISARSRPVVAAVSAVAAALAVLPAASPPSTPEGPLAAALRLAYGAAPGPRWRRASVRLPDGREVAREAAYREDPLFVPAAARLLASRVADDAPLGAWLLASAGPSHRAEARRALVGALAHPDPRAAFEAALALARDVPAQDAAERAALSELSRSSASEDVRTAAAWAAGRLAPRVPGLAPSFRRGVSWWMSEGRGDDGATSFRRLASLGVTWVSIHTWDPLQRGPHDPLLAASDRHFGRHDLRALVRSAHSAGLAVMVKPHLELRGYEPTEEERRILRGGDEAARRALFRRLEARFAGRQLDHGKIEMRSEQDWRRWFAGYESYLLPYVRQAQDAGADLFCVGRELDLTVRQREADWRRVIARVRAEFSGPLTYSANFDDWQTIGFWDALDFIGVSAYFPLLRPTRPAARRDRGGLGPCPASAAGGTQPLEAAGPVHRGGLPVGAHRRAGAVEGGAHGRRRLAPGPLLRGHAARAGTPAVDRGRLLLAVGAHLTAAVPGPLVRDRRQAGVVHDGPLVRALTEGERRGPWPTRPLRSSS